MKRYIYVFIFFNLLLSCNFNGNVSYENEEMEKENAQSVIGTFYMYSSKNDLDKAMSLFSDSFYKITNKKDLKDFLVSKNIKLGVFKDYSLRSWKTNRVIGTNPKTEYLFMM
ncbi:hypothetical protein [Flavobacterium psychroterrae]